MIFKILGNKLLSSFILLLATVLGIDKALNSVNEKENSQLQEAKCSNKRKRPPGQIKNVGSSAVGKQVESVVDTANAKGAGDNGLNKENDAEPDAAELCREHIDKHIDPNMALLDLEHGDSKHAHNNEEVRRKFVTTSNAELLTTNLTKDNVYGNDENHDKANCHAHIVKAVDNFTN